MAETLNLSTENRIPELTGKFLDRQGQRSVAYSARESELVSEARAKLNGLTPYEFQDGAEKQLILGTGLAALEVVMSLTPGGYLLADLAGGAAYEFGRSKDLPYLKNTQKLSALDWVIGLPVPWIVNPLLVGGIRNYYKGYQVMQELKNRTS